MVPMNASLNNFQAHAPNWRANLKKNARRTRIVILLFFLLYLALGLFIDLVIQSQKYPGVPLDQIFNALITFHLIPYATFITLGIAFISLLVTYAWYDKLMLLGYEYYEVTPETAKTVQEQQLYNVIEEMKVAAGLRYMPKVFIIEAPYMNAFASGYNERNAMVAITRGLMEKLDRAELTAVMAHELSHIRHLDIKLTLMASVLANLMVMMIDVLFWGVLFSRNQRDREGQGGGANWLFIIVLVLRYVLPIVTVLLMLFLSRTREYMADAGCVELMRDNEPLARALIKISGDHEQNAALYSEYYNSTPHESVRRQAYIFDPVKAGIESFSSIGDFFSTHPSLKARLAALGFKQK
jgi:heat shock protein HtpX